MMHNMHPDICISHTHIPNASEQFVVKIKLENAIYQKRFVKGEKRSKTSVQI